MQVIKACRTFRPQTVDLFQDYRKLNKQNVSNLVTQLIILFFLIYINLKKYKQFVAETL